MTWDYQTISSPELLLCALDTLTQKAQVSVSTTFKLWLFHITAGIEALGLSEWKRFLEEFKKKKNNEKTPPKIGGRTVFLLQSFNICRQHCSNFVYKEAEPCLGKFPSCILLLLLKGNEGQEITYPPVNKT